jgi:hypothetical protein
VHFLRYTIPPGIQTPIALKTLPEGICTVRLGTEQTIEFYADKDGIIRFFVSSTEESGELKFVIDCDKVYTTRITSYRLRSINHHHGNKMLLPNLVV